jgi:hypothetical protein
MGVCSLKQIGGIVSFERPGLPTFERLATLITDSVRRTYCTQKAGNGEKVYWIAWTIIFWD